MAEDFVIDSGIAIPEDYHVSIRIYPFAEMIGLIPVIIAQSFIAWLLIIKLSPNNQC